MYSIYIYVCVLYSIIYYIHKQNGYLPTMTYKQSELFRQNNMYFSELQYNGF